MSDWLKQFIASRGECEAYYIYKGVYDSFTDEQRKEYDEWAGKVDAEVAWEWL